jgi:hypothetical protein
MAEYALLAQGRKIALVRCATLKLLYSPGGPVPTGLFLRFVTGLVAE